MISMACEKYGSQSDMKGNWKIINYGKIANILVFFE